MVEKKLDAGAVKKIVKVVNQLLHAVRRRNRAADLCSLRASCSQMSRAYGAPQYHTRAHPLGIARINAPQRRRQQIICCALPNYAAAPLADRFELPRSQISYAARKSRGKL